MKMFSIFSSGQIKEILKSSNKEGSNKGFSLRGIVTFLGLTKSCKISRKKKIPGASHQVITYKSYNPIFPTSYSFRIEVLGAVGVIYLSLHPKNTIRY